MLLDFFRQFFLGLIIFSGLLLCGTYEGMSTEVSKTLDQINTVLVYLFALECILKLVAFGPLRFFCDNFNIFDTVVVLAGLPNLFLDGLSLGFIRIMRLFRIIRSVKVLRKIKSVRMTIRGLQLGLPDTGSYLLLFTLFVYIATLAGMQLPPFYAEAGVRALVEQLCSSTRYSSTPFLPPAR